MPSASVLTWLCLALSLTLSQCDPQLNLPTPQPEVFYNGYTPNVATTPAQLRADRDRDQRYGPPYSDAGGGGNTNDALDDFRYGQTSEERMRLGYAYPSPRVNFSDSPFSEDRFSNHNYGPLVSSSTDRSFGNDPSQNGRYSDGPIPTQGERNYNPNDQYNYNNNPNVEFLGINNRNRFENPFLSNQDRFNLNQGYLERQRYQQDRRYQQELEKLRNLLVETDQKGSLECTANVAAQWNFETNVNDFTQTEALNAQQRYVEFQRITAEQSKRINKDLIFDRRLYRQLMLQSEVGPNALPLDVLDRYNRLLNEMLFLYNSAGICAYQQPFQCDLHYIPHLKDIMAKSRDWDELQHTWVEYHRKAGRGMRDSYEQLIDVMQDVASVNNVTNGGEYWYLAYESGNFRQDMDIVWEQIRPLYESLHSYVRRKLRDYYGPDRINRIAPIPSHILGNMYGQSWSNVLDILIPYPGRKLIDVTPRMVEQGYTPLLMFQLAEEFFTSINMSAVGPEFYRSSIFEQPLDRRVLCEPSAWDFCNRHDFRVKICTDINQRSLISVHHEMAHIQYFLQYRHLPKIFRNGANPAFHQAVGDAIGLSVSTPRHLQTLGLLQRSLDESSYDINYLFTMAIDKVAFLPFALSLDNWRYDVFSGNANKRTMNCHYWNLREKYSGIKPPVLRSEKDFDLGAKYHIPANIPYIKYFFSTVLQFQIYRAMCREAGQYIPGDPRKPLHQCDIYRQPAAGNILKKLMAKGASQPWQEVLQETLQDGRLDGSALREYFAPLEEWLRLENLRTNEYVGWNYDGDYCKRSIETAGLQIFGGYYNGVQGASSSFGILFIWISFYFSSLFI
ncbi:angiotensin-converting enzyme [Drosophila serrata]|uniref:angiotensin-converting enzyme n=1 Tax=Drosophila serrata TaxID=7274 RepID=UPI000A1D1108|nr:angiotensin-converting enzyme [Drosophila serrata]